MLLLVLVQCFYYKQETLIGLDTDVQYFIYLFFVCWAFVGWQATDHLLQKKMVALWDENSFMHDTCGIDMPSQYSVFVQLFENLFFKPFSLMFLEHRALVPTYKYIVICWLDLANA